MNFTHEQKAQWLDAAQALLDGEAIEYQDRKGDWWETDTIETRYPHRRKPKPKHDPLAEVKAAHAAGKRVEIRTSYGWSALADPVFNAAPSDYRIAPWTLPEPPEGQKWHRADWTEDMLIGGWRPLLLTEIDKDGDEVLRTKGWEVLIQCHLPTMAASPHCRTLRPLPTPPRMVPLEASDVPPGSVFRGPNNPIGIWAMALSCTPHGVIFPECRLVGFSHMTSGWLILRPGETEWRRCEKEAKS